MKYVEPIKSIILTFLVLLSISLTFIIWSYEPEYEFLEDPDVQQVVIGQEKPFNEIVRPYKALYRLHETLHGTVSVSTIDQTMELLASLDIGNIRVAQQNASVNAMNRLMNDDEQTILFFNTTMPLETLNVVLKFNQNNVENVQFDRIIINTRNIKTTHTIDLRFINTQTNVIYRAAATVNDEQEVDETLHSLVKNASEYSEFKRSNELDLYLPKNSTDVIKFTYFIGEISQDLLTDALFTDASILQKTVEGNVEKYFDGMSLIMFDTSLKTMNYVNSSAENGSIEPAAKLVNDTFNFVNDQGGFNGDFRLNTIDPSQKLVDYQMFFQGHPVYSTTTLTRISTTWGDNRLFRYRRPYYELETDITTEKTGKELSPGVEVIEHLNNQVASANSIDDVVIGYLLVQDQNTRLIVLEPSWFAISSNSWTRITPPDEGSVSDGLE
jgi:regulatory protein YycH of two-component signal transduction system YycFG